MYKPINILVTGGCGFIGSNFLNMMVKKYPEINFVNLDCLYYCASLNNIEVAEENNYRFIEGNLNSVDLIKHILIENNIDTVIHFAAQSHVDNSFNNSLQYTTDNILGTHNLLECCRIYSEGDKIKRFIHVSTDEVYGESHINDESKKSESSILCPTNPYAATKAGAELIAMAYYHSYKMPIIVTRGNNVYGERQYPEKLIPKFICLLQQNKKCTIHGTGNNLRSFIHVDDVIKAFDTILNNGNIGEIYNIGSNDEYSVMNVAKILITKLKPHVKLENFIEFIDDRDFNDWRYNIDTSKLESLGWKQTINFEEGINRVINWYTKTININIHWNIQHQIENIMTI